MNVHGATNHSPGAGGPAADGLAQSVTERFWSKVDRKNGPIVRPEIGRCWVWTGSLSEDGYGRIRIDGAHVGAHRLACEMEHGPPPFQRADAAHVCDHPPCCRGSHLSWQTRAQNIGDAIKRGLHRCGKPYGQYKCGICGVIGHNAQTCTDRPHAPEEPRRPSSKRLTEADVIAMRRMAAEGMRTTQIGPLFGVSGVMSSLICSGKRWKHVPLAPTTGARP